MIAELVEFAKSQPFLVGGCSTVLLSSGMYLLRSIPDKIGRAISGSLVSHLTVNSRNDFYNQTDHYVWQYRIKSLYRRYEPADRLDEDDHGGEIFLNAGYGSGWGYWRGVFFSFTKEKEEKGFELQKTLHIKFYTRDVNKVRRFVEEAAKFQRGEPRQRVYVSSGTYWRRVADKRLRPFETVFINGNIVDDLKKTVDDFRNNEELFNRRGVPYKLCILLYGPPGTGKTSLIHALASYAGLDINYVTGLGSLSGLLSSRSNRPGLIVIEDIDTLALLKRHDDDDDVGIPLDELMGSPNIPKRKAVEEKPGDESKKALHEMLNATDGFVSASGSIICITSNYPERLDSALLRPGRIDLAFEIGPLDSDAARAMFLAFYGSQFDSLWDQIDYQPTVGAQLQSYFMACQSAAQAVKMVGSPKTRCVARVAGVGEQGAPLGV